MAGPTSLGDWLAYILGYNTLQNNGVAVPGSPGARTLNLIGAVSIADNPSNGSTDVVLPSGSTGPTARVVVTGPATVTATAFARHQVTSSGGAVILNLPAGAAAGTRVSVKCLSKCGGGGNSVTVAAPGGGTVEQLLEQAGAGGVYAASTVFQLDEDIGSPATWEADGSNNWESV